MIKSKCKKCFNNDICFFAVYVELCEHSCKRCHLFGPPGVVFLHASSDNTVRLLVQCSTNVL